MAQQKQSSMTTKLATILLLLHGAYNAVALSRFGSRRLNLALGRPTEQSSVSYGGVPGRAVDGDPNGAWNGDSCTHTGLTNPNNPWWPVDLGSSYSIGYVVIFNRQDCCRERLSPFRLHVGDSPQVGSNPTCGGDHVVPAERAAVTVDCRGLTGRYVGILLPTRQYLTLCEVEVYEASSSGLQRLGCWKDTANRAIPTLEGQDPGLDGAYQSRTEAIRKCRYAAVRRGYTVFAVQNGGWCASSANALQTYRKYGASTYCQADGEGGPWANEVYKILPRCPDGYIYHEPSRVCYRVFDDEKNYDEAVETCSSDGGTLAMPRDTATNNFLIYLKNALDNSASFRFGLTDHQREGTWVWADNVILGNFSAWGPGEPNNYRDQDEDCAEYFSGNHNHNSKKNKWNDGLCSRDNRKFICQVIPSDDSATVPSVGTKRPSSSTGPVMEQSTFTSTIMPEVTPNTVLARVNVSLTLTAPHHVNQSSLRDSITQSLKKQAGGLCGNQCQIGEIFLHIVTDTNGARKKRQAGDQVLINVIIQLIVMANQQQGDTTDAVAAKNLLQEKADVLRQLVRDGKLYVDIDGEQVRLVDNNGAKRNPPWLVGVVCAAVVVLVLIAVVTVLLCRRKHSPGINVPGKIGNEMKNVDTPERHDQAASEGTVNNIIYNTEDEGFVDNVIYNAGDEGTVDNVIYQGENSKSNDQKNAPESQYETVN